MCIYVFIYLFIYSLLVSIYLLAVEIL